MLILYWTRLIVQIDAYYDIIWDGMITTGKKQKNTPIKKLILLFKSEVKKASVNPKFIHHQWFLKYHLEIVEKIALELCKYYPQANKDMVLLLVWLHDYEKIIDFKNQYNTTHTVGSKKLLELGFNKEFVEKAILYVNIFDNKSNISKAPIEVKIVSSADGASHLIGPFYAIYWKEHSQQSCEDLIKENRRKALVDWNKKIVLPEVKKAFLSRYKLLLERRGKFPKKYLL